MKFITVATTENAGLKLLLKSCDHFGIDLKILGFGEPYYGNGSKIDFITSYLKGVPPEEIVFFTDAYDSFFVRDVADIEQEFFRQGQRVLFSAEDNYYFRIQNFRNLFLHPYYRFKYPESKSSYSGYRYLNSGGYMGTAANVLSVLEACRISKKMHSDQVNLHRFYVRHPDQIGLDYNHDVFTNYGKFATPDRFSVENDALTNTLTNTKPYVFHFPGPTHRGLSEFADKFSFLR